MSSATEFQAFDTTAGEATAELKRRGINADNPITIVVPSSADLFIAARAASRARVVAAGLSDDDVDALIKKARAEIAAEGQ